MTDRGCKALLATLLVASMLGEPVNAWVKDDGPQHLNQLHSIGDVLSAGSPSTGGRRPVHILYVHGIAAKDAGDSQELRKSICDFLKDPDCDPKKKAEARDYADTGDFAPDREDPPSFQYLGQPAWKDANEWRASAPFVDHYVLRRQEGQTIVVDEINWWPLVMPLKCRGLLPDETRLAGPKQDLLKLCAHCTETDEAHTGRFLYYQWLEQQRAENLEAMHPNGARLNRILKANILDWGVSDALMAIGAMRPYFRDAMRQLFIKSAAYRPDRTAQHDWLKELRNPSFKDREFIVVSHSLGSFLVFSTLDMALPEPGPGNPAEAASPEEEKDLAARYILERTSLLYFFANQIPLLELADLQPAEKTPAPQSPAQPTDHPEIYVPKARFGRWQALRSRYAEKMAELGARPPKPPQIVAWSDPSDLLTWRVPEIEGVVVDNLFVRNTWWHWLIAGPSGAHDNYARNKDVIRIMLKPTSPGPE